MKFIKYNSIKNVTDKNLMKFKESELYDPSATWFVTEKVHGCLDENTLIQTTDGDKTIRQICEDFPNINYKIKSYNLDVQCIEYVNCNNVSVKKNLNNWMLITLEDGSNLILTYNHKVYLPDFFCYKECQNLLIGDNLLVKTNSYTKILKIIDIKPISCDSKRYDIETEKNHNFFANNILVHNSNMSIIYDNEGTMIPAKRTSVLSMEDSGFYNFQKIFDKYDFRALASKILEDAMFYNSNYNYGVSIHGELCGGFYPNMPLIPGAKQIQKEIKYSNDTEFIVFDIRIYNKNSGYIFISHDKVVEYCKKFNIPVVPIIFQGTLDECLAWSSEHNADMSEIWKIFGMPHEVPNNIREGHVIKSSKCLFDKHGERIIFKDKNDKFKENGGTKESKQKAKKISYSPAMNELFNEISMMICIPRFNNVTSKYGEYTIKNFSDIMKLMVEDIFEDLEDNPNMALLSAEEKATLKEDTLKKVSAFMGANKKELF